MFDLSSEEKRNLVDYLKLLHDIYKRREKNGETMV